MDKGQLIRKTEQYVRDNVPTSRKPDVEYFNHVFGAQKFALLLAKEYNADNFVVEMAILLHDIGANAGPIHAEKSAEMAIVYLSSLGIDSKTQSEIVECIKRHSMGSKVETLEQQIIQDADGLVFITDSYKYFFEKGIPKYGSVNDNVDFCINKTEGMTEKIRTKKGKELKNKLLPEAVKWLEGKRV